VVSRLTRSLQQKDSTLRRRLERLGGLPPLAWVRRRFPGQVAWVRARLDPTGPRGFGLTFALALAGLAGWIFGGLTQDVVAHDEMFFVDPKVASWFDAHRVHWLNEAVRVVTWLGSSVVVVPLAAALGGWLLLRRRDWRPLVMLGCALGGAIGTYAVVKWIVGRPRPAMSTWLGHFTGSSFPSGHATQVAACFAMAALVLSTGASPRRRVVVWGVAAAVTVVVGLSRLYLGAHWLSDVLAGWAVGALWVCVVAAVSLWAERGNAGREPRHLSGPAGPEANKRAA
jgi:membrane-associated phospholipid phosphatase